MLHAVGTVVGNSRPAFRADVRARFDPFALARGYGIASRLYRSVRLPAGHLSQNRGLLSEHRRARMRRSELPPGDNYGDRYYNSLDRACFGGCTPICLSLASRLGGNAECGRSWNCARPWMIFADRLPALRFVHHMAWLHQLSLVVGQSGLRLSPAAIPRKTLPPSLLALIVCRPSRLPRRLFL